MGILQVCQKYSVLESVDKITAVGMKVRRYRPAVASIRLPGDAQHQMWLGGGSRMQEHGDLIDWAIFIHLGLSTHTQPGSNPI